MKASIKIAILCSVLSVLAACGSKTNPESTPDPKPVVNPETRTLTFILPDLVLEEGEEAPVGVKTT